MKDLILPTKSKNSINLSEINPDFKGLIIGYYNNKPKGFFSFNQYWFFSNNVNSESNSIKFGDTLYEVITELIREQICTNFKVIDFGN